MKKQLFALALAAMMLPGTALAETTPAENTSPNSFYERAHAIIYGNQSDGAENTPASSSTDATTNKDSQDPADLAIEEDAPRPVNPEDAATTEASQPATDTFDTAPASTAPQRKSKRSRKAKAVLPRYVHLLDDGGLSYDLDTRSTRWIALPHNTSEYILDTWVKLTPNVSDEEAAESGDYSYPPKYYLAHYYIRPKTQQIQFLSELEVSGGRPNNEAQGRSYMAQNWEDLIPDSIEDTIYHGTLSVIKEHKDKWSRIFGSSYTGPRKVSDFIEEYLRISI